VKYDFPTDISRLKIFFLKYTDQHNDQNGTVKSFMKNGIDRMK